MSAQFSGGGGPHPYILPLFNVQGVVGDIRSPTFNHCSVSREGNPPLYSIYVPFPWSLSLVFYLCSLSRLVVPLYSWLFRLLILIKHELPCDKTNIVTQRCPGSKSYSAVSSHLKADFLKSTYYFFLKIFSIQCKDDKTPKSINN